MRNSQQPTNHGFWHAGDGGNGHPARALESAADDAPPERATQDLMERSRTLARVDAQPVWSIVCFFVAKPYRRRGLMVRLLQGAVAYAASQGAQIVEGYPVDPPAGQRVSGGAEGYMGLTSAFRKAGFVEVARPSERRAIMRRYLAADQGAP